LLFINCSCVALVPHIFLSRVPFLDFLGKLPAMNLNGTDQRPWQETVEAMRAELMGLSARLAAIERALQASAAASKPAPADVEAADETLVYVITAAVAAYLGVKPHIRQIRLVGGASWAQQGRVTIQASHALAVRHE
jgi:methylmalonyl-CoA carboxyltransferase large subunit